MKMTDSLSLMVDEFHLPGLFPVPGFPAQDIVCVFGAAVPTQLMAWYTLADDISVTFPYSHNHRQRLHGAQHVLQ